jgi:hypothetical protein
MLHIILIISVSAQNIKQHPQCSPISSSILLFTLFIGVFSHHDYFSTLNFIVLKVMIRMFFFKTNIKHKKTVNLMFIRIFTTVRRLSHTLLTQLLTHSMVQNTDDFNKITIVKTGKA